MKVNVKHKTQGCLFEDIGTGEVFYSTADPDRYLLRTDYDNWVAVDIETGVLCHINEFELEEPQYYIVKAEVTIS